MSSVPSPNNLDALVAPLRRAKLIALGLLGVATVVFLAVRIAVKNGAPAWLGYVGAAAEAAMVGALADWFAVTALFRHPLGLPIPHTAIVPRRKNQIGTALGDFVQQNFMAPDALAERVRDAHPSRLLVAWLARPGTDERVAQQLCRAASAAVQVIEADEMTEHLEHALTDAVKSVSAGPLLADLITAGLADGRRSEVIDAVMGVVLRVLSVNRSSLRIGFAERSPWWVPGSVDERVFERLYTGILDMLGEVRTNPTHELRIELERNVDVFVGRLRSDPVMAEKLAAIRDEALHDPRVREWLSSAWSDGRRVFLEQADDSTSRLRTSIAAMVRRGTKTLQDDHALAAKVDQWAESFTKTLANEHGHEVARIISSTVERWDADETSRRIELQIGRDLQFIRINGTIVGGMVGLLIYTVGQLIG
jgi:uncharacterized membrane-anchored protein YjiN (DUF445 family)